MCLLHTAFSIHQPTPLALPSELWIARSRLLCCYQSGLDHCTITWALACTAHQVALVPALQSQVFSSQWHCTPKLQVTYGKLLLKKPVHSTPRAKSSLAITTESAPSLFFPVSIPITLPYSFLALLFIELPHYSSSKYAPISFWGYHIYMLQNNSGQECIYEVVRLEL